MYFPPDIARIMLYTGDQLPSANKRSQRNDDSASQAEDTADAGSGQCACAARLRR